MSADFEDPFLKDPNFRYHREDPTRKLPRRAEPETPVWPLIVVLVAWVAISHFLLWAYT